MDELSNETRDFLRSALDDYEPSDEEIAENQSRVLASVGGGALSAVAAEVLKELAAPAPGAAPPTPEATLSGAVPGASGVAFKVGLLVAVGLAAATGVVAVQLLGAHEGAVQRALAKQASKPDALEPTPEVAIEAVPEATEPAEAIAAPAPEVTEVMVTAPRRAPPPPSTDDLREEARLIGRAQSLLRAGREEEALRVVAEAQRRFPRGALRPERTTAHIVALCRLGRHARAAPLAARFRASYPPAHLLEQIESACASEH